MTLRTEGTSHLVRLVTGLRGRVALKRELVLRFDYGSVVPWMERLPNGSGLRAIAGPDMVAQRTPAAVEQHLVSAGLVRRYTTDEFEDGLSSQKGVFLARSFWLPDAYAMTGRRDDAGALFEHLLSLRDDLGLLAEEYDPAACRMLGNFPQAFSCIALINTAYDLSERPAGSSGALRSGRPVEAASDKNDPV